jgi:hypothetical protein
MSVDDFIPPLNRHVWLWGPVGVPERRYQFIRNDHGLAAPALFTSPVVPRIAPQVKDQFLQFEVVYAVLQAVCIDRSTFGTLRTVMNWM